MLLLDSRRPLELPLNFLFFPGRASGLQWPLNSPAQNDNPLILFLGLAPSGG
jgi:hypothetical protein